MKRINQPYYTNQECPVFPSIQHSSGNIGWYIKLEQAISVKIVVPSTALLYSAYKKKNKREVVWFRALQPKCTVPLCTWSVRTFKPLNCSALVICLTWCDRGLERLRLIACVQTPIFCSMRREEGPSAHRLLP